MARPAERQIANRKRDAAKQTGFEILTTKRDGILGNVAKGKKDRAAKPTLRVFAGETEAQAKARRDAGNAGVRPEQVSVRQGETSRNVGITGGNGSRPQDTRSGLAIN